MELEEILVTLERVVKKEDLHVDFRLNWIETEILLNYLKQLQVENSNISNELIHRTDELNDSIPKQVIRDKFKRINETKIKIDKINARNYMIFGDTERATGWFINVDYIEKILLDVPGYKIEEE